MPSIADQLSTKTEEETQEQSDEIVSLDDAIPDSKDEGKLTAWSLVPKPHTAKFWKSFDKNSWDTLEGIYEMLKPYREPTKSDKDAAYSKAVREGAGMEGAIKARDDLKVKYQLPAIIPTAIQIGKELQKLRADRMRRQQEMAQRRRSPASRRQTRRQTRRTQKPDASALKLPTTPVLDEVLDYAKKTTGIGALFGDDAAKQEFYQLVENDPFAFYAWILPIIGKLRIAKITGTAGKVIRAVGKTADILDMPVLEGATAIGESIIKFKNRALSPEMYDQPFDAKYGRDTKTGEEMTSTVTPEQITKRSGLKTEDIPALGLTENPSVHHREGIVGQTGGSDAAIVKERYSKTQEGIENKYDEIIKNAAAKSPQIEVFDINSVGQEIIDTYEAWQFARRGEFNTKFNALGKVLDQPLQIGEGFELLGNTRKLLEDLKNKPGSKLISDTEVEIVDNALSQAFEALAQDGLTLADFDALRTQFRKNVKSALRKEGLYEIGSGDPAQKVYASLTEDFYDLVENEVNLAPQNFPEGFLADVRGAKASYRDIILMEDSLGAKFIRRNL